MALGVNRKYSENNKIGKSNRDFGCKKPLQNLLVNLGSNFSKINLMKTNKDFDCKGYKNLLANLRQYKKFQPVLYTSLSN